MTEISTECYHVFMLKTSAKKPQETVFKNIVREVVREEIKKEIAPFRSEIKKDFILFKDKVLGEVREIMKKFRNDLAGMKDEIIGELVKSREETTILRGDHQRVLDLEDKVEDLEKIHPQGQHLAI